MNRVILLLLLLGGAAFLFFRRTNADAATPARAGLATVLTPAGTRPTTPSPQSRIGALMQMIPENSPIFKEIIKNQQSIPIRTEKHPDGITMSTTPPAERRIRLGANRGTMRAVTNMALSHWQAAQNRTF